eukprot:5350830-Pyramimonas_sp.AAC.1
MFREAPTRGSQQPYQFLCSEGTSAAISVLIPQSKVRRWGIRTLRLERLRISVLTHPPPQSQFIVENPKVRGEGCIRGLFRARKRPGPGFRRQRRTEPLERRAVRAVVV